MRSDVVIIGGGPAGLYAAQGLALRGLTVRVLEEHDRIGEPVHCTGILGAETFTLPGVPRDAILGWPTAVRFHSPAGYCLRYEGPGNEVCIVDRGAFDRDLAQAAVTAGAVVVTSARAVGLEVERDRVAVRVWAGGQAHLATARVCLLACGARYGFQRALGWGTPPLLFSSAQSEVAATTENSGLELFFRPEVAPTGFAWLVPLMRGQELRAKVGVMAVKGCRRALGRLLGDLRAAGRISGPDAEAIARPLPLAPLARTYGDRLVAIGDAAGLVKPTTGGGVYYGLLSAGWASEFVALAFERGDFSASTLAGYEEEWRARLGAEIRVGVWLRRLVARLAPGDLDALIRVAITDGIMPVVRRAARFNWHRELILETIRHPGVSCILLRRMLSGGAGAAPSGGGQSSACQHGRDP